jgi:hypothetical protein
MVMVLTLLRTPEKRKVEMILDGEVVELGCVTS